MRATLRVPVPVPVPVVGENVASAQYHYQCCYLDERVVGVHRHIKVKGLG